MSIREAPAVQDTNPAYLVLANRRRHRQSLVRSRIILVDVMLLVESDALCV